MASSQCPWVAFIVISAMTSYAGVLGRSLDVNGFLSHSPNTEEPTRSALRTHILRRWKREITETNRDRCAELAAPWMENAEPSNDNAKLLRFRVRPFAPGSSRNLVFPGKTLFNFVRQVYRCCQEGLHCRNVKGIQGHLSEGTAVEFLITRDVSSIAVMRAELHLQLFNPHRLSIQPVLPSLEKRHLPTKYSLWSRGDTLEMRVDLLFFLRGLQEAPGGAGGGLSLVNMRRAGVASSGGPRERATSQSLQDTDGDLWGDGFSHPPSSTLELGLVLSCSQGGVGVSCDHSGVHLLHTPFLTVSYR